MDWGYGSAGLEIPKCYMRLEPLIPTLSVVLISFGLRYCFALNCVMFSRVKKMKVHCRRIGDLFKRYISREWCR